MIKRQIDISITRPKQTSVKQKNNQSGELFGWQNAYNIYPPEDELGNGKSPCLIGDTSSFIVVFPCHAGFPGSKSRVLPC